MSSACYYHNDVLADQHDRDILTAMHAIRSESGKVIGIPAYKPLGWIGKKVNL